MRKKMPIFAKFKFIKYLLKKKQNSNPELRGGQSGPVFSFRRSLGVLAGSSL